ncbi:zinc ribbon domain-containing protein [Paenibacillus sp. S150]|uniref:zinc ribbon domain-containing protein n=1 Tax=Paenibacillus sp. S150 TaxID=2749826 RepID=UPI002814B6B6|nr:zinc ribbon domain-containing protein [Paenibacillus sp. S150]
MDIIGFTYQQERSFDTMEEAAGNPGNIGAGMMNTGLGLGMGLGFAGPASEMMNRMARGINMDGGGSAADFQAKACSGCGTGNSAAARFCSGCGRSFLPPQAAGAPANGNVCRSCGGQAVSGAKFCPHCGAGLVVNCTGCGHVLQPGQKFCAECGTRAG